MSCRLATSLANFKVSFGTRILRGILQWTSFTSARSEPCFESFWYTEYIDTVVRVDLLMHIDEVHLMKYNEWFSSTIEIASCWFVRGFFYYIGMKRFVSKYFTIVRYWTTVYINRRIPRQINLYAVKCYKEKRSERLYGIWSLINDVKSCFLNILRINDNQDPIHRSRTETCLTKHPYIVKSLYSEYMEAIHRLG